MLNINKREFPGLAMAVLGMAMQFTGCNDTGVEQVELQGFKETTANLYGQIDCSRVSPVVPTLEAMAADATARGIVRQVFPRMLGLEKFTTAQCARAREFLGLLAEYSNPNADRWSNEGLVTRTRLACEYYRVDPDRLTHFSITDWSVIEYNIVREVLPTYGRWCPDEPTYRRWKFGSCARTDDMGCENRIDRRVDRLLGNKIYPGLTDPKLAAGMTLKLGSNPLPKAENAEAGARAFREYSRQVWLRWHDINAWDYEKIADIMMPLEERLAEVERSFPIVSGSWSDAVWPMLTALGCHRDIPGPRRQAFLDLTRDRIAKTGFWGPDVSAYYKELPKTVEELCSPSTSPVEDVEALDPKSGG